MIVFQVSYSERNTENTTSDLYFNKEYDYSKEITIWAWLDKNLW